MTPIIEREQPDTEPSTGSPIAALVIAVPISLVLWWMVFVIVRAALNQ